MVDQQIQLTSYHSRLPCRKYIRHPTMMRSPILPASANALSSHSATPTTAAPTHRSGGITSRAEINTLGIFTHMRLRNLPTTNFPKTTTSKRFATLAKHILYVSLLRNYSSSSQINVAGCVRESDWGFYDPTDDCHNTISS